MTRRFVATTALAAVGVRLAFVGLPLTRDEGGFLLIGGQWSPGSSLYGDYWVDRPPGLIALHGLAEVLGGQVPLRVLAAVSAGLVVLLAARLGASVADRPAAALPSAVAAAGFTATPLFLATEASGELLALPWVLGSMLLALRAVRVSSLRAAFGAGALGMAGALVKQNLVDGLLTLVVLVLVAAPGLGRRTVLRLLAAGGAGALAVLVVALGLGAARGTSPAGLWEAVVTFRVQATGVLADHWRQEASDRPLLLLRLFVFSGAPLVIGAAAVGALRKRGGAVLWLVLTVWEGASVLLGGSFWPHYLMALVPSLVVGVALLEPRRAWRVVAPVAVLSLGALAWVPVHPPVEPSGDREVLTYLAEHAGPDDTLVVAYGNPTLLRASGLTSPYEEVFSLPVRVRDPDLSLLTEVLSGPEAPTWVAVRGRGLRGWALDPTTATAALRAGYERVALLTTYSVWKCRCGE